ncbi:DUF6464 family protein [Laspinema sp. A4]|uniref:DUF6464 family protein n=1 Tax=Laspinema sp. D2d TaxID=2953686 RepID=UPI0021BB42CB|nr:DUF6464 family protein [Laspinema sp. D2d]MCT7984922.1 DUF6464 family protein [Laspinema sp. D2d]
MPKLPECHTCRYNAQNYLLVCALHPSGPTGETCKDYDPSTSLIHIPFQDFLGLGELVDIEAPINNPYHDEAEENWAPDGWQFVSGELRRVD